MSGPTCSLCPKSGEKRLATVEAWVVMPGWNIVGKAWTRNEAARLPLCSPCYDATKQRGDLVPGAEMVVL